MGPVDWDKFARGVVIWSVEACFPRIPDKFPPSERVEFRGILATFNSSDNFRHLPDRRKSRIDGRVVLDWDSRTIMQGIPRPKPSSKAVEP